VLNLKRNAKNREKRKQTLIRREISTTVEVGRFVKTTGVCHVCRKHIKLDIFELTCSCCNVDKNLASVLVILKEELSL
jgi:hypothetical protein